MIIWADFPSGQQGIYGTNTANMLNGVWAEVASAGSTYAALVADPDPNIAAAGVVFYADGTTGSSGSASEGGRLAIPAEVTTLGVGFRWWLSKLPTSNSRTPFLDFRTNANAVILTMRVTTTGQLEVASGTTNGQGGSTLGTTTGPVITANAYSHIEVKATKGAGTGAAEVRVNGVAVLTLTGLTLSASNIAQIYIGVSDSSGGNDGDMRLYTKDLVLWDTTGSEGNDFQGSVAVHDLYTDADISLNWTPSTGSTGWDLIDETTPNDADYIQAGDPAPAAAVFSLTDLPEDVTSVRALLPIYRAVKTDGGDCNIQVGITPNNTNWDDGADRPMTTAFTYWWDVSHLSPATSAPWTPVEVNAAYVRANRTL